MKVATWNVNSIRSREPHVRAWLEREQPDALLLQEIKCEAESFPADGFRQLGYHSFIVGQKSYNGVAILTRQAAELRHSALPGLPPDPQARYNELRLHGLVIGNLYLPNGNSGGPAGYQAKLQWMEALVGHARALLDGDADFMLAGDYNVCPSDEDYAPGTLSPDDALIRPESRSHFRTLLWLGLTDAVRQAQPRGRAFTFWDYQAGCWPRDRGLRIDHALLSPRVAERLTGAVPDRAQRDAPQPSDHVPLVLELSSP